MPETTFQRVMVKTLLTLPSPILRMMSGGGVVYRGGATLDPAFQFLAYQARNQPPMSSLTALEARAGAKAALAMVAGRPAPDVRAEPLAISGPLGDIPTRVYRPRAIDPRAPVLVYLHMGGGVIGDLETCHVFCTHLAQAMRAAVVSVDYRLAPEHRHPAGLEDCLAAYRYVRDHAEDFGAPPGRAAIGGESMGGYFSAIIAQDLRAAGEAQPDYQLLIFPCVDVASETPSMAVHADASPLGRDTMDWFLAQYLPSDADPADPRVSPLRARDVSGLAPALIFAAGFDPLSDQAELYAKALLAAGGQVIFRRYANLPHGFTSFGLVPAAEKACEEIAQICAKAARGEAFAA